MKRLLLLGTLIPFVSFSMMNEGEDTDTKKAPVATSSASVSTALLQGEEQSLSPTETSSVMMSPLVQGPEESIDAFALRTGLTSEGMDT